MSGQKKMFVCFTLFFAVSFGSPYAELLVQTTIGFQNRCTIGKWMPVHVEITSRGPAVHGTLEVIVTSGSQLHSTVFSSTYALAIDVPAGMTKNFSCTVFPDNIVHDLLIRIKDSSRVLYSDQISLRFCHTRDPIIVIADQTIAWDIAQTMPQGLLPLRINPEQLPVHWFGYDAVQSVLLSPETVMNLKSRQFTALHTWIKKGGQLIIAANGNASELKNERMKILIPMRITGIWTVTSLQILEELFHVPFRLRQPIFIPRAEFDSAHVKLSDHAVGLVAEHFSGLGSTVFCAFDIRQNEFMQWKGSPAFWKFLLSEERRDEKNTSSISAEDLTKICIDSRHDTLQGIVPALIFLILFIAAMIAVYVKNIRSDPLVAPQYTSSVWIISLAGIVVSLVIFFHRQDRYQSFYTGIEFTDNSLKMPLPYNRLSTVALFSLKPDLYSMCFNTESSPLFSFVPAEYSQKIPNRFTIFQRTSYDSIHIISKNWSLSAFHRKDHTRIPVSIEKTPVQKGIFGVIRNQSEYFFPVNCVLYRHRYYKVSELHPFAKTAFNIDTTVLAPQSGDELPQEIENDIRKKVNDALSLNLIRNSLHTIRQKYADDYDDALCYLGFYFVDNIEIHGEDEKVSGSQIGLCFIKTGGSERDSL